MKKKHTLFTSGYSRKKQNRGVEDMEFPGVLFVGLGISKGCNAILYNFQGWSFDLYGISKGKVNKWKIPGVFSKKNALKLPCLSFFLK